MTKESDLRKPEVENQDTSVLFADVTLVLPSGLAVSNAIDIKAELSLLTQTAAGICGESCPDPMPDIAFYPEDGPVMIHTQLRSSSDEDRELVYDMAEAIIPTIKHLLGLPDDQKIKIEIETYEEYVEK